MELDLLLDLDLRLMDQLCKLSQSNQQVKLLPLLLALYHVPPL